MGNLFFPKMAAGNLVRNRRFVFPYLLTGLITVAMFYNMTFLAFHKEINNMPGGATIPTIMSLGTGVVGIFAVIFLLYTNTFLMKRRQKEIGLYNILGMSKGHIALVMLWETFYTCLITIAGGLLLGILLSKLILLLLYKVLFFTVSFGFTVNWQSVGTTALLFAAINLAALLINLLHVRLSKPVELLKGGSVGEKEPKTKLLLVLLGLVTLGAGYFIALTTEAPLQALMLFFLAVILVIVGTYCLFTAGSIAFLKAMKRRKDYYYQPKHFIGVSGMLYRMKQNAVGLANICILSTMVLVTVSTCVCLYLGTGDALNTMYPHDITYSQSWQDSGNRSKEEVKAQIQEVLDKAGMVPTHVQEMDQLTSVNSMLEDSTLGLVDPEANLSDLSNTVTTLITTAESYRQMTGTALDLAPGEVALNASEDPHRLADSHLPGPDLHREGVAAGAPPTSLWRATPTSTSSWWWPTRPIWRPSTSNSCRRKTEKSAWSAKSIGDTPWTLTGPPRTRSPASMTCSWGTSSTDAGDGSFSCRDVQESEFYALYGGLLFFRAVSGGCSSSWLRCSSSTTSRFLKGTRTRRRFAILEKVGMSQQQVRTAIRSQVRMVFFLPLLGAMVHLAVAFKMITKLLAALGLQNIPLFALCCAGTVAVFAVGYFVIYHLTARTYYKIVR